MPVRSVRLPYTIWHRLEIVTTEVNRRRRRRLGTSSVIRALLTYALDNPGDALNFEAKLFKPARTKQLQAAKLSTLRAEQDSVNLFREVFELVERLQMTPAGFAKAVGGNRHDLGQFYHRGTLPEGDTVFLVTKIREWLATYTKEAAPA